VVKGDGDVVWARVLADCSRGTLCSSMKAAASMPRLLARALGPSVTAKLHVGIGSNRPWLSQALLVLLGVADRLPIAAHM
jgi:hypothetical protein